MKIGIDFSIKSTAVAIRDDKNNILLCSFPRTDVVKPIVADYLRKAGIYLNILPTEPALPKKSTIAERERSSLIDATMQVSSIISQISNLGKCENSKVGIEGFSFASTGNRLAQISGYQWLLRYNLFVKGYMDTDDFHVYAPMTVKATAGKGNYKKEDMIDAFLNSTDPDIMTNDFWIAMKNSPHYFQTKKGKWEKPVDDIVDAFWVLRTLENNVENS